MMIDEGRNGFVVPAADAQALRARLEWCLQNPAALQAMRPAALATAAAHTWDAFRATVRSQLTTLLEKSGAP